MIARIIQVQKADFLPSLMKDSPIVLAWYTTNIVYVKLPRKWDRFIKAKALCNFDIIMQEIKSVVPTTHDEPHKLPAPIYEFINYMFEVRDAAKMKENEIPFVKKGRIGVQKGGKGLQDTLCLKDITRKDLCTTTCANCKHNFVLPVGSTSLEIHHHNDKVKVAFRDKMAIWNTMSVSRKGPKPKVGRSISQKLMCLCTRMHCLNRSDGNGCFKCEWACTEAHKQDSSTRPYFDQNMNCVCPVCICQCSVVYFRHEEKRLAIQAKEEYLTEIDKKPQSKIGSFIGLTAAIADLTMD